MRREHWTHRRDTAELTEFGQWLRKRLDKAGRQQGDVATALQIRPQTVSQWMIGYSTPRREMLRPLAAFLGTTTDEILKRL